MWYITIDYKLNLALKSASVIFSIPNLEALRFFELLPSGSSVIRYFVSLVMSPRMNPLLLSNCSNCFLGMLSEPVIATLIFELFEDSLSNTKFDLI